MKNPVQEIPQRTPENPLGTGADLFFFQYVKKFLAGNSAGRELAENLTRCGVGLMPLVDHCTIRTHDVDLRSGSVIELGFQFDSHIGVLDFGSWWAKVFRKPGYPALFIDQAFAGERGKTSLIADWVDAHGDECFHHIAVRVEAIDIAIATLKKGGVSFPADVVGLPGSDLRQIFTQPELLNGRVHTVLELIERHHGYTGFLPPQADGLMESTRKAPVS